MYTLSVVVEVAAEEFKPFLKSFMPIFHNALQDPSTGSAYYAGITLRNLTYCIGSEVAVIILLFCFQLGFGSFTFRTVGFIFFLFSILLRTQTLSKTFSKSFKEFIEACLQKDPTNVRKS